MADSTSIHHLNGDRHLGLPAKVAYFPLNALNNSFPELHLDPRLTIRDFERSDVRDCLARLSVDASPSRTLSDIWWMTLPWADIQQELGTIRILDVGCGSGAYGARLAAWSGDRIASYVGVDVKARPSWPDLARDSRFRFIEADANRLDEKIADGTNFVMSQSTIEHIDQDLEFFRRLRNRLESGSSPVLQIHLCPAAACLRLYLFHGVRQYTPRTLSKISRLFHPGYPVVFRLGGAACNRLHWQFITLPILRGQADRRTTDAAAYRRRLADAIERDMTSRWGSAAFHALVIHTHPHRRLF